MPDEKADPTKKPDPLNPALDENSSLVSLHERVTALEVAASKPQASRPPLLLLRSRRLSPRRPAPFTTASPPSRPSTKR